ACCTRISGGNVALGSPPLRCYNARPGVKGEMQGTTSMGEKPVIRAAVAAVLSIAIGCSLFAAPAASQSISDRFKSLFGGKSDDPAQNAPFEAPAETDLTCPPVAVRAGASTFAVAPPGKQPLGNDLRYQAIITKT